MVSLYYQSPSASPPMDFGEACLLVMTDGSLGCKKAPPRQELAIAGSARMVHLSIVLLPITAEADQTAVEGVLHVMRAP